MKNWTDHRSGRREVMFDPDMSGDYFQQSEKSLLREALGRPLGLIALLLVVLAVGAFAGNHFLWTIDRVSDYALVALFVAGGLLLVLILRSGLPESSRSKAQRQRHEQMEPAEGEMILGAAPYGAEDDDMVIGLHEHQDFDDHEGFHEDQAFDDDVFEEYYEEPAPRSQREPRDRGQLSRSSYRQERVEEDPLGRQTEKKRTLKSRQQQVQVRAVEEHEDVLGRPVQRVQKAAKTTKTVKRSKTSKPRRSQRAEPSEVLQQPRESRRGRREDDGYRAHPGLAEETVVNAPIPIAAAAAQPIQVFDEPQEDDEIAGFERALMHYAERDDYHGQGEILRRLGHAAKGRGHLTESKEFYLKARECFRKVEDQYAEAAVLLDLGQVLESLGDNDAGSAAYRDANRALLDVAMNASNDDRVSSYPQAAD